MPCFMVVGVDLRIEFMNSKTVHVGSTPATSAIRKKQALGFVNKETRINNPSFNFKLKNGELFLHFF